MSTFAIGVVFTCGIIYLIGAILMLIYAIRTHAYDPKQISPVQTSWPYTFWGRPIAIILESLLWPIAIVRVIKEAL